MFKAVSHKCARVCVCVFLSFSLTCHPRVDALQGSASSEAWPLKLGSFDPLDTRTRGVSSKSSSEARLPFCRHHRERERERERKRARVGRSSGVVWRKMAAREREREKRTRARPSLAFSLAPVFLFFSFFSSARPFAASLCVCACGRRLQIFRGDPLLSRIAVIVLMYYSGVWARSARAREHELFARQGTLRGEDGLARPAVSTGHTGRRKAREGERALSLSLSLSLSLIVLPRGAAAAASSFNQALVTTIPIYVVRTFTLTSVDVGWLRGAPVYSLTCVRKTKNEEKQNSRLFPPFWFFVNPPRSKSPLSSEKVPLSLFAALDGHVSRDSFFHVFALDANRELIYSPNALASSRGVRKSISQQSHSPRARALLSFSRARALSLSLSLSLSRRET